MIKIPIFKNYFTPPLPRGGGLKYFFKTKFSSFEINFYIFVNFRKNVVQRIFSFVIWTKNKIFLAI